MDIPAGELAGKLGLNISGATDRVIRGAAPLEEAEEHQIAFVGGRKNFAAGALSGAGVLLAPPEYAPSPGQTVIITANARASFAQALSILYSSEEPGPPRIDPTARIGPDCTIGPGAAIGAGTIVHSGVRIYPRVTIGARCIIHSGAVIGADGFGFEMIDGAWRKFPQVGTVEIGDDVEIGANTCIDRAALGRTVIGSGTKLDNLVHVGHNCRVGKHVVIAAQTGLAGGVTIGDHAVVGGQVGIGDKARIESRAVIGSGAGVLSSKIVRAGEPVWGTPARPLRQCLNQLAVLARLSKRRARD